MRRLVVLAALLLPTSASAQFSSLSGSGSSYSVSADTSRPSRVIVTGGLTVRPDAMAVPFTLRSSEADADKALARLKEVATALGAKVAARAKGAAVRMRHVALPNGSESSKKAGGKRQLLLEGAVEVPFAGEQDYWQRAAVVAALTRVFDAVQDEAREEKGGFDYASFAEPRFYLRNDEAARGELLRGWLKRVGEFTTAVKAGQTTALSITDCEPPADVTQSQVSAEEIALTARFSCRLDAVKAAAK